MCVSRPCRVGLLKVGGGVYSDVTVLGLHG